MFVHKIFWKIKIQVSFFGWWWWWWYRCTLIGVRVSEVWIPNKSTFHYLSKYTFILKCIVGCRLGKSFQLSIVIHWINQHRQAVKVQWQTWCLSLLVAFSIYVARQSVYSLYIIHCTIHFTRIYDRNSRIYSDCTQITISINRNGNGFCYTYKLPLVETRALIHTYATRTHAHTCYHQIEMYPTLTT